MRNELQDTKTKPWNNFGLESCEFIEDFIKSLTTYQILDLGDGGGIKVPEITELVEHLVDNTTVIRIDIEDSYIDDQGAIILSQILQHNNALKCLNLSINPIGNKGAIALAQKLQHNTTLAELYLNDTEIEDEGIIAIAQALYYNTTLTDLHLEYNKIGVEGIRALVNALQHNTTLTHLYLDGNKIGDEEEAILKQCLQHNKTLNIHFNNTEVEAEETLTGNLQTHIDPDNYTVELVADYYDDA